MILASDAGISTDAIVSMTVICLASFLAPLLSYITRWKVPAVVFMLILGILIGPEVLGWANMSQAVAMPREYGLGMLFLLAGWEIEPETLRGRQSKSAIYTWAFSLIVATGGALLVFHGIGFMTAVVLGIAVSSTALGTLLPIIKDAGLLESPVGKGVMVHGAIGELAPIFAMAILLSTRAPWITVAILFAFFAIALVLALVPRTLRFIAPWVARAVRDGASHTSQMIMRGVYLLLTVLMAITSIFQLDVVLGAFAAGIILRALVPQRARRTIEARLDVLGYSMLIPVFFITSGMNIHISAVIEKPLLLVVAVIGIGIARGIPIFIAERLGHTKSGLTGLRDQVQMSLYSATGLPIIVAVTEIAVQRELIDESSAAILVSAGACTVLLFPLLAFWAGKVIPGPKVEEPDLTEEAREYKEAVAQAAEHQAQAAKTTAKPKPKSSTVGGDEITIE
ncbi:MAG: cation:proton antiporter [Corynebacterium sp.]|nr:cation:proton antiporter [Corynebacterium sp.]